MTCAICRISAEPYARGLILTDLMISLAGRGLMAFASKRKERMFAGKRRVETREQLK